VVEFAPQTKRKLRLGSRRKEGWGVKWRERKRTATTTKRKRIQKQRLSAWRRSLRTRSSGG
jgi:hypothetical protein